MKHGKMRLLLQHTNKLHISLPWLTRDAEFIIPHGNTTLLPWDRILCLTQDDTLHLLMDAWGLSDK